MPCKPRAVLNENLTESKPTEFRVHNAAGNADNEMNSTLANQAANDTL
jgi:hypothetical protein